LAEHFEFTTSQALATPWALKAAGLPAKNIQNVHEFLLPQIAGAQPAN
jgi:hypothetical protein